MIIMLNQNQIYYKIILCSLYSFILGWNDKFCLIVIRLKGLWVVWILILLQDNIDITLLNWELFYVLFLYALGTNWVTILCLLHLSIFGYLLINLFLPSLFTWGNRKMVAAATIVIMATAKKAQQIFFALYHSYNPHNPPGMHLDFQLSFEDCPRASPVSFDSHTMW